MSVPSTHEAKPTVKLIIFCSLPEGSLQPHAFTFISKLRKLQQIHVRGKIPFPLYRVYQVLNSISPRFFFKVTQEDSPNQKAQRPRNKKNGFGTPLVSLHPPAPPGMPHAVPATAI